MTTLSCRCGAFTLALTGEPLLAAECHCGSCRKGAAQLAERGCETSVLAANRGTPYVLYRKDRVAFPNGTSVLRGVRLSDKAATRRVIATCCNTPVFLDLEGGHWLSFYASLWPADARPAMNIRTQTGDIEPGTTLDSTLPAGALTTARFYGKLLVAWAAMGFRVPPVEITDAP